MLSAPARARKPQPRRGFFGCLVAILRFAYRLAAYPNRIGGALMFCLAVAIMVNALMLQHSRHPAPLFRRSIILPVRETPVSAPHHKPEAAAAAEAAKPARDPIGQWVKSEVLAPQRPGAEAEPAPTDPHRQNATESSTTTEARPAAHDPIAQLLKPNRPQPAAAAEQPKRVLAVQHALIRLGFVLQADGRMGALTRRAIEQYERDHGLPIHAELTPKLLHRLAAESGVGSE